MSRDSRILLIVLLLCTAAIVGVQFYSVRSIKATNIRVLAALVATSPSPSATASASPSASPKETEKPTPTATATLRARRTATPSPTEEPTATPKD